jgi:tRNA(Ile)-lysidine synthase
MENSEQEFIIAVSGGSDSMCLLDLYKKQVKCVCHVNYNLRLSSIRDTEIVKEYCLKNNLNLEILNCDEAIKSKYHSEDKNEESSLRKIRYDFFCECAEKYNVNTLLVAHQYDDFLESA